MVHKGLYQQAARMVYGQPHMHTNLFSKSLFTMNLFGSQTQVISERKNLLESHNKEDKYHFLEYLITRGTSEQKSMDITH